MLCWLCWIFVFNDVHTIIFCLQDTSEHRVCPAIKWSLTPKVVWIRSFMSCLSSFLPHNSKRHAIKDADMLSKTADEINGKDMIVCQTKAIVNCTTMLSAIFKITLKVLQFIDEPWLDIGTIPQLNNGAENSRNTGKQLQWKVTLWLWGHLWRLIPLALSAMVGKVLCWFHGCLTKYFAKCSCLVVQKLW